jgi:metal-responsive CopG/Arc/MetJ family transcriptional regulator
MDQLPADLVREIEAAAMEEHRSTGELVGEAIGAYLKNRRWRQLVERGQSRARELGLSEADLPRLITESRAEHRQGN